MTTYFKYFFLAFGKWSFSEYTHSCFSFVTVKLVYY